MKFCTLFALAVATIVSAAHAASITYEKVQPFAQPEPVTISEKAAVKFKPQVEFRIGCVAYPAVNAAGETNKGQSIASLDGCFKAPLGPQVYGRATWFNGIGDPRSWYASVVVGTHDWQNAVVWIDNPAVASPKVKGLSTSKKTETDPQAPEITKETFKSEASYGKLTSGLEKYFNGTSPMLTSTLILGPVFLRPGTIPGKFQDLIMWDQLTAPARTALNGPDIGNVPFSDANFQKKLKEAWPF